MMKCRRIAFMEAQVSIVSICIRQPCWTFLYFWSMAQYLYLQAFGTKLWKHSLPIVNPFVFNPLLHCWTWGNFTLRISSGFPSSKCLKSIVVQFFFNIFDFFHACTLILVWTKDSTERLSTRCWRRNRTTSFMTFLTTVLWCPEALQLLAIGRYYCPASMAICQYNQKLFLSIIWCFRTLRMWFFPPFRSIAGLF